MAKSKSYGGLIFLVVLIAAAAGGGWYYFSARTDKQVEFQTVKVTRGEIVQSVTATGDLQPVITVDVGAQVSGQIKEVLVDFNAQVKAGDVLARIDEANATQKLRQAEADLASAQASNQLTRINAERTRDLFKKNLVSQSELDSVEAQLAQSNATLLTRTAAVENAKLDLQHCTITAPIDGMVLNRQTDKGRTVNSSTNAPTLFTLVNNLSKMQINAAVAEADVGLINEGQTVKFTVDAFPNQTFTGTVRQVRNAATANQSVVSYATIIDVNNESLKLKPGMTANVSIIVTEKNNVLRVANSALRVRVPPEFQPKAPTNGSDKSNGAVASTGQTDAERARAEQEILREVGFQRGTPATAEMTEKARALAKDKGLDPDLVVARMATPGGRGNRGGGGGGGRGGRGGGGGGGGGGSADRGFNNTVLVRSLYKVIDPAAKEKQLEQVSVTLGVSDGLMTEVLDGLQEGDTVLTGIITPNSTPVAQQPGSMQNPFQGGGRGMGGMGGGGGGRRGN